ncbi:MAG TPA: tetratricopeptide repeat protein [Armatimonadota bacterium]
MFFVRCWNLGCALLMVLLLGAVAQAEVSPVRLALLRGTIALAQGEALSVHDLAQAAQLSREDWRSQMLYGESLALAEQPALAKGQLRRAALLAPWRPEPWLTLARVARAHGDLNLEYASLAGLLRVFPNDPVATSRMAALYRQLGQPLLGAQLQQRWEALLPPIRLETMYSIGNRPATLAELRQLASVAPVRQEVLAALAGAEWRAGNLEAAYTLAQRLYQLTPTDRAAQRTLIHLCFLTGRIADGLQWLRTFPPGDETLERNLVGWSIAAGQYAEAISPLNSLLARTPRDPALWRLLGTTSLLTGDVPTAVSALHTAWQLVPDQLTAPPYVMALLASGRAPEAETVITQAIRLFPQESMLQVMLAHVYSETGRLEDSAKLLCKLARRRPEAVELTLLAGERLIAGAQYESARQVANSLRDQYPMDVVAVHGAIQLFRQLFYTGEASLTLTRYLGPTMPAPFSHPELLATVAHYAAEENRLDEATTALREIFKVNPEYRSAYLDLGRFYLQQGQWSEATRIYREAATRWPQDTTFALALARVERASGNLPRAVADYRSAIALLNAADPWLELGDTYDRLEDRPHARECWQAAMRLPGGLARAQIALLSDAERDGTPASAAQLRAVVEALTSARVQCQAQWQSALATRGLTASAEELAALLTLAPDQPDPAPWQARLSAMPAP